VTKTVVGAAERGDRAVLLAPVETAAIGMHVHQARRKLPERTAGCAGRCLGVFENEF